VVRHGEKGNLGVRRTQNPRSVPERSTLERLQYSAMAHPHDRIAINHSRMRIRSKSFEKTTEDGGSKGEPIIQ
jgi:hypothetical protein